MRRDENAARVLGIGDGDGPGASALRYPRRNLDRKALGGPPSGRCREEAIELEERPTVETYTPRTYQPRPSHLRSPSAPMPSRVTAPRYPRQHVRNNTTTLAPSTLSRSAYSPSTSNTTITEVDPPSGSSFFSTAPLEPPATQAPIATHHPRKPPPTPLKLFPSSPTNSFASSKCSSSLTSVSSPTRSFRASFFLAQKSVFEDDDDDEVEEEGEDDKLGLVELFRSYRSDWKRRLTRRSTSTMGEWKWSRLLCGRQDDEEG
jgi:hypothetical protein